MAQFEDTWQKSCVIALNFAVFWLITLHVSDRWILNQTRLYLGDLACSRADARWQETWRGSLCVLLTRHRGTFDSVADGRWLHRKSHSKSCRKTEGIITWHLKKDRNGRSSLDSTSDYSRWLTVCFTMTFENSGILLIILWSFSWAEMTC